MEERAALARNRAGGLLAQLRQTMLLTEPSSTILLDKSVLARVAAWLTAMPNILETLAQDELYRRAALVHLACCSLYVQRTSAVHGNLFLPADPTRLREFFTAGKFDSAFNSLFCATPNLESQGLAVAAFWTTMLMSPTYTPVLTRRAEFVNAKQCVDDAFGSTLTHAAVPPFLREMVSNALHPCPEFAHTACEFSLGTSNNDDDDDSVVQHASCFFSHCSNLVLDIGAQLDAVLFKTQCREAPSCNLLLFIFSTPMMDAVRAGFEENLEAILEQLELLPAPEAPLPSMYLDLPPYQQQEQEATTTTTTTTTTTVGAAAPSKQKMKKKARTKRLSSSGARRPLPPRVTRYRPLTKDERSFGDFMYVVDTTTGVSFTFVKWNNKLPMGRPSAKIAGEAKEMLMRRGYGDNIALALHLCRAKDMTLDVLLDWLDKFRPVHHQLPPQRLITLGNELQREWRRLRGNNDDDEEEEEVEEVVDMVGGSLTATDGGHVVQV